MSVSVTSILKGAGNALHRIRVKLYPNYLPKGRGTYFARTNNQKVLNVDDVCRELKDRVGFPGDHTVVADYVRHIIPKQCTSFATVLRSIRGISRCT